MRVKKLENSGPKLIFRVCLHSYMLQISENISIARTISNKV